MRGIVILLLITLVSFAKDYTKVKEVREFINVLVKKQGYSRARLNTLFANVEVQKIPLRAFVPKVKKKRTPEQITILNRLYPKY